MNQFSLFDSHQAIGHNGGPPLDPPQPRKVIEINKVPSINTLLNHAWGACYRLDKLDDNALVKAWSYSHVANWMQRFSVTPKGYVERRHHHIRPQIADLDRIALIDAEMARRGLMDRYELDIALGDVLRLPIHKR
ncbi:MAG: hypothetical protein F8N36_13745 [Desulfovibrio sp.]|nr:hypothetical protein [Desulfovibrio sp.]